MPHEIIPRGPRTAPSVDAWLTHEDWLDAARAGRVPAPLAPGEGRVFARVGGRWHRATLGQVADPSFPWAPPLPAGAGEDCERALAWHAERRDRAVAAGEVHDGAATAQRAAWCAWRGPFPAEPVRYSTDEPPIARSPQKVSSLAVAAAVLTDPLTCVLFLYMGVAALAVLSAVCS